ncbi:ATP-binding protein [Streptomyces sp. CA-181903]|uniref:ATP-binding protein n=1 Tax=Streptomyces sp. CA-181903 TaxID=3240055 RepID=UPI003D8A5392
MSGRTTRRDFRTDRRAVFGARRYVESVCRDWKVRAEPAASAVLLVSELATNAVLHATGGEGVFELCLRRRRGVLVIEVTDWSGLSIPEPTPNEPEFVAEVPYASCEAGFDLDRVGQSGRGLLIVACLATKWGVRQRLDGPGKTVWVHLELR